MFARLNKIYHEFPQQFWVVVVTSFIDGIGNTMVFPFFALYVTQKFHVGMTQAGMLLGAFSLAGLVGGGLGGALTDKFGRRKLILFGLVFSAISTVLLGLTDSLFLLYPISALIGLIGSIAGPAHGAMIADILPESKRSEGFGILRVVGNMTWIVGPTIAGFLASKSFLALFLTDALMSCIVASIVYRFIEETKPATPEGHQEQTIAQTMGGYSLVFRDFPFVAFIVSSILMGMVYLQMYGSLSVFLRDNYGINPQGYGILMSTSAITVILFQFWTTRQIKSRPPLQMMALGAIFYAIGFTLFGIVQTFILFALNIVIITIGEMIVIPTSQTLVAGFAPGDMRGRYMAVFGLSWAVPATIGPGAAGYILDNYNPNLLWYLGGALTLVAVLGFFLLHLRLGTRQEFVPVEEESAPFPATTD
jgi:MFS family permease